jgi:hypothetical protein
MESRRLPVNFALAGAREERTGMARVQRILAATGGLIVTGAIAGAVLGALILGGGVFVIDGFRIEQPFGTILGAGAVVGAVFGSVLAPIAAWVLLRSVPIGRAVLETALGTLLGAAVMWLVPLIGPVWGGMLGFVVAAVRLRFVARRGSATQRLSAPPG